MVARAAGHDSPVRRKRSGVHSAHGNRQRGIVTAGLPYLSVLDALEEVQRKPDILKLGVVHPLPRGLVMGFLKTHEEVKILEKLDPFLENQIKSLAFDEGLSTRIVSKTGDEDMIGEYTPRKTRAALAAMWPDMVAAHADDPDAPSRPDARSAQRCDERAGGPPLG